MGGATKISNAFSKDVFSNINNICVVINGVEYSSIAKSYATNQTYVYVDDKEARDHKPTVAIMGEGNKIKEMINYEPEATVM